MTDYTRQRAWYDPSQREHDAVTIVGCGGIGSFTAMALARLGVPKLDLIDFDTVEEHNLPNQHFRPDQIGMNKAEALAEQMYETNPACQITTRDDRFNVNNLPLNPVIIAGLDSMTARADLWNLVRMKLAVKLFIDGRLAGQDIVHYCVRPARLEDCKGYQATLYSDDDAIEDTCIARSIIDVGFQIASLNARATRLAFTEPDERQAPVTYLNQRTLELARGEWV